MKNSSKDISLLLDRVLSGSESITTLQALIDSVVIEDKLPNDATKEFLKHIYDLQLDLELISEQISSSRNVTSRGDQNDIVDRLSKYRMCFGKV